MNAFRAILGKDLRVELRTWQSIPAMALFAIGSFVLFRFGLDRVELEGSLAAGVLLVTILFAGILAVNRLFVAERDEGGFERMRLAPVPGSAVFFAKATVLFLYLCAFELVAVVAFSVFFLSEYGGLLPLIAVLLLFNLGISFTGALISPIAANSRARDLLVPILLIPLLVPAIVAAAQAAGPLLAAGGPEWEGVAKWMLAAALYDLVFATLGYALFDFLLDD